MSSRQNIMVFRFSAMGDVALTLLALKIIVNKHPQANIYIVTKEKFAPLFYNQKHIKVIGIDFNNYRGLWGLFKLFLELRKNQIDILIDLHQNLRTFVLKLFFRFSGIKILTYEKGRTEKRKIINKENKTHSKHTVLRYLQPFEKLFGENFSTPIQKFQVFDFKDETIKKSEKIINILKAKTLIGIAPFAQHQGKVWPIEKYIHLCKEIAANYPESKILFFGGGKNEKDKIDQYLSNFGLNTLGDFTLTEELMLISKLNLMICGDSSNMHLAAMTGIPVISIWGATHTSTGFGPLFGNEKYIVEIPQNELNCRPCSVFGNQPCYRKDFACLVNISPEMVLNQIRKILI